MNCKSTVSSSTKFNTGNYAFYENKQDTQEIDSLKNFNHKKTWNFYFTIFLTDNFVTFVAAVNCQLSAIE